MWFASERAIAEAAESFGHQRSAQLRKSFGESRRGFGRGDASLALEKHVASVHAGVYAHCCDAGDGFAVGDGPLDRGCTAIFWEKGSVKIDPAEAGNSEQARRNDLTVGNDDDGVRIGFAEKLLGFGSTDFFRLEDGYVCGKRDFLYR